MRKEDSQQEKNPGKGRMVDPVSDLGHVVSRNIEPEVSTSMNSRALQCNSNTLQQQEQQQNEPKQEAALWRRTQPLGRAVADNGELENRSKQFSNWIQRNISAILWIKYYPRRELFTSQ